MSRRDRDRNLSKSPRGRERKQKTGTENPPDEAQTEPRGERTPREVDWLWWLKVVAIVTAVLIVLLLLVAFWREVLVFLVVVAVFANWARKVFAEGSKRREQTAAPEQKDSFSPLVKEVYRCHRCLDDEQMVVKCPRCGGEGKLASGNEWLPVSPQFNPCHDCGGKGIKITCDCCTGTKIHFHGPCKYWERGCYECRFTGHVESSKRSCAKCGGDQHERRNCPLCRGSGKGKNDCRCCDGQGLHSTKKPPCHCEDPAQTLPAKALAKD